MNEIPVAPQVKDALALLTLITDKQASKTAFDYLKKLVEVQNDINKKVSLVGTIKEIGSLRVQGATDRKMAAEQLNKARDEAKAIVAAAKQQAEESAVAANAEMDAATALVLERDNASVKRQKDAKDALTATLEREKAAGEWEERLARREAALDRDEAAYDANKKKYDAAFA